MVGCRRQDFAFFAGLGHIEGAEEFDHWRPYTEVHILWLGTFWNSPLLFSPLALSAVEDTRSMERGCASAWICPASAVGSRPGALSGTEPAQGFRTAAQQADAPLTAGSGLTKTTVGRLAAAAPKEVLP